MHNNKAKFQQHCERLITKLNNKDSKAFATLRDNTSRVQFVYPLSLDVDIQLASWQLKDLERAESLKVTGNKLFKQRNLFHAIQVYNDALLRCPQDHSGGQQLYAVLIANRSAVFFEQMKYDKVLKDIEFLEVYDHHPTPQKLQIRAGKSCEALGRFKRALEHYTKAMKCIQDILQNDPKNECGKGIGDIQSKIDSVSKKIQQGVKAVPTEQPNIEELAWLTRNLSYPALSPKLAVQSDFYHGRFIVAKEAIAAGEIVAMESPYACVLDAQVYKTNCASCTLSLDQFIACKGCCEACFCDLECMKRASSSHQHECKLLLTLYESGVSVNCLMALRMVTQRTLDQLKKDEEDASVERNITNYKTEDYYNVSRLVTHKNVRQSDELLHYSFMAVYLLRLLKMINYFGEKRTLSQELADDEAFVGSLILKYLQLLQYNAHEISELQNVDTSKIAIQDVSLDYKTGTVGAALYPTLALFNHSCDPTVIRYNIGNTMVLRTIKAVKCGEEIFENYGPLYTTQKRDDRIEQMRKLYCFECECRACEENWPLFQDMNKDILRISCECGNAILTHYNIQTPTLTCGRCYKNKNLLPVLTGLMPLEVKTNNAEELFTRGAYEPAMSIYAGILGAYVKYLSPPFVDMVQIQQRLKTCMVHKGNKRFDYKPPVPLPTM